jgi:hypothetical protein
MDWIWLSVLHSWIKVFYFCTVFKPNVSLTCCIVLNMGSLEIYTNLRQQYFVSIKYNKLYLFSIECFIFKQ